MDRQAVPVMQLPKWRPGPSPLDKLRQSRKREKQYAHNARRKGRQVNMSLERIFLRPCTYCGTQITLNGADRLDNDGEYEQTNVVPACTTCNFMKYECRRM